MRDAVRGDVSSGVGCRRSAEGPHPSTGEAEEEVCYVAFVLTEGMLMLNGDCNADGIQLPLYHLVPELVKKSTFVIPMKDCAEDEASGLSDPVHKE